MSGIDDGGTSISYKIVSFLTKWLGFGLGLYAVYIAFFGAFTPSLFRGGSVAASVVLVTLLFLASVLKQKNSRFQQLQAILLLICSAGAAISFSIVQIKMDEDFYFPNEQEIWVSFFGILAMLEISRRLWGNAFAVVASLFVLYGLFGNLLPAPFNHPGFDIQEFSDSLWYNYNGAFGTPISIVVSLVWVFIVFGVLLKGTGATDTLLKFATALTARTRGGPAHAAILSSSMFGTMSGAAIANVVGTGTFTIPVIKKRGFKPAFAGGIEATASCGGQIVPPIMGAAAFVLAELVGVSYLTVVTAAIFPAFFYYLSLFLAVSVEAKKMGIEPLPDAERPEFSRIDYLRSIAFAGPIVTIIVCLVMGYSAAFAGCSAVITALILGFVSPELRRNPARLIDSFAEAGTSAAKLLCAVVVIGIIIGVVNMTGIGVRFAGLIEGLGQGNLYLSLFYTMIGAIILGMGLPTLPAYLIIVVLLGPAFANMGLEPLVLHMFVLYYAVASSITPPVALASYAAAAIAQANPMQTSLEALRLGVAKFAIPFVFVTYPSLLLVTEFDAMELLFVMIKLPFAIWLICTAFARFDHKPLTGFGVAVRLVLALAILWDDTVIFVPAILGLAGLFVLRFLDKRQ